MNRSVPLTKKARQLLEMPAVTAGSSNHRVSISHIKAVTTTGSIPDKGLIFPMDFPMEYKNCGGGLPTATSRGSLAAPSIGHVPTAPRPFVTEVLKKAWTLSSGQDDVFFEGSTQGEMVVRSTFITKNSCF